MDIFFSLIIITVSVYIANGLAHLFLGYSWRGKKIKALEDHFNKRL
jgi:hypothetical protein